MRRRTFLASLPAAALGGPAFATSRGENPNRDRPDVRMGDRVDGATWAGRSTVWGTLYVPKGSCAAPEIVSATAGQFSFLFPRRSMRLSRMVKALSEYVSG